MRSPMTPEEATPSGNSRRGPVGGIRLRHDYGEDHDLPVAVTDSDRYRGRMGDSQPLFVRLPRTAAERLEAAAAQAGTSKREIITRLVTGDDLVVGQQSFRPAEAAPVLTLDEAAELLRVEPAVVHELAAAGELPGREIGGQWRFARAAVLAWLGA